MMSSNNDNSTGEVKELYQEEVSESLTSDSEVENSVKDDEIPHVAKR